MTLFEEISSVFNRVYTNKGMRIRQLPDEYPAWAVKYQDWYGVIVPMPAYIELSEEFANARIHTEPEAVIGDQKFAALILSCENAWLRDSFAWICARFADPGPDGHLREKLVTDPVSWWEEWKALLGNNDSEKSVHAELGELVVLENILKKGYNATWGGLSGSVHDIETDHGSYEVKSTTKRYGYAVTVSSPYQLDSSLGTLTLAFCRFEPVPSDVSSGISINMQVDKIVELGYSREDLEKQLAGKKLERGKTARNKRYNLLELKFFPVEDSFPAITRESFVGGVIPSGIIHMTYDVDLAGIPSRSEP